MRRTNVAPMPLSHAEFGLHAELLSREMIGSFVDANPFTRYPLLIARMDQPARNDDLLTLLDESEWDLIVVSIQFPR